MFLVFNKDKIMAFVVACSTVFALFLMSSLFAKTPEQIIQTSTTQKQLPIYSVKTEEKKIAITINCAWNADDIDKILETLEKQQVKTTFFMVGDWIEKNEESAKKIFAAGHELGNHSYNHPHINNLNYDKNIEQIKKCSELKQMWERIEPKLQNGSIILMHNGTENTANSLNDIITNIKNKGFTIVPVSELIYKDNYTIDNNGEQHKQ